MSTHDDDDKDLIDLGSPILFRHITPCNSSFSSIEISDTLIDSELPVLEKRLQTLSACQDVDTGQRNVVDVEDILITIDDDDVVDAPLNRSNSLRRSKSDIELRVCKNLSDKSWSCDNLEALNVLQNLDDILNASLAESLNVFNSGQEETIEECLLDLDNYLKAFESTSYDDSSSLQSSISSITSDLASVTNSTPILRKRLQQIEANYARFITSSHVRSGLETSTPDIPSFGHQNFLRGSVLRSTIGPISSSEDAIRIERHAHGSSDCCTGSVTVEIPPTSLKNHGTSTWVRTSMRRLQHLRLPSNASVVDHNTLDTNADANSYTEAVSRPVSAPSRLRESRRDRSRIETPGGRARSSSASSRSRRPRSLSSSVTSLASTVDSSPSGTPTPNRQEQEQQTNNSNSTNARGRPCERLRQNDMPSADSPIGQWPHSLSSMMACLGCTLGLFNISRFAILTVHFGANFIFQFIILSLFFGLPLFTLQLCLGQQLGAGVIDMWRISPLFQGVGVALLLGQTLLGLYSIVGVSWMFVFFRDSFITKVDKYRWAEPFLYYRDDIQSPNNGTYKLTETIPDYFSGVVLQRHHLTSGSVPGTIKFQLAFNLAVVWMIVFVSLSKGLRSYGKVIYVFTFLPIFGTFVLCAKILGMMPPEYINIIFPETNWDEFFLNPKSWLAAAQETFLTWGILGTSIMQIASHNKNKHLLQRDSSLVAIITFTILLLVALLANTCVQILRSYDYNYLPNSFEQISSYTFLRSSKDPLPPSLANTPVKYMTHNSLFMGEKVIRPGIDSSKESGYQVLRLATELMPATFAVVGSDRLSPFWAVLFYFVIILFGIAQQLAIWHCVITGIIAIKAKLLKSWETTITLVTCICGFILGLPMATEFGIFAVYFMDYTVGGIWWMIVVILLQIVAVFMVRGRPYSGDTVVTALFNHNNYKCILTWAPALLSFTWNVILPVALMVLCITTFKNGNFRDIFIWHHAPTAEYWPLWARQFGSLLQLFPILLIPFVAVIQSYRYLNSGPSDILERIQLLYRPPIGEHMTDLAIHDAALGGTLSNSSSPAAAAVTAEDPPPKYTPPPSYTTATGARLAKFLRQSIRRSVRRLANVLGESSSSRSRAQTQSQPPPPDYNAVLVEMNQTDTNSATFPPPRLSTLERLRNLQPTPGSPTITAAEVASILRSSFRRSGIRGRANTSNNAAASENLGSLSAENLVDSAAPIGETSLVLELTPATLEQQDFKREATSSVI